MEFDQPKEKAVGLSMIYSGATLMTPFALSQGLLVTEEFEKAVRGCKAEVTRLAKECQCVFLHTYSFIRHTDNRVKASKPSLQRPVV